MSEAGQPGALERVERAMAFLQEAVYRSRAAGASPGLAAPAPPGSGGGQCGLGEKAAVVLDLSEAGRAHFDELWPDGLGEDQLLVLQGAMTAWIERQDALDRKRNHFMKDFRHKHGFDRTQYTEAQRADWDAGLTAVNEQVNAELRAAATQLPPSA